MQHVVVARPTTRCGLTICRRLITRGHRVVALTERPRSEIARGLERAGATLVELREPDRTWGRALNQAKAVVFPSASLDRTLETELDDLGRVLERVHRPTHLVYCSSLGAHCESNVPFLKIKGRGEKRVRRLRSGWTIIRPGLVMENFDTGAMRRDLRDGRFSVPIRAEQQVPMVALEDVAELVIQVLESPSRFDREILPAVGDLVTGDALANTISSVTHIQASFQPKGPWLALCHALDGAPEARAPSDYRGMRWQALQDWAPARGFPMQPDEPTWSC